MDGHFEERLQFLEVWVEGQTSMFLLDRLESLGGRWTSYYRSVQAEGGCSLVRDEAEETGLEGSGECGERWEPYEAFLFSAFHNSLFI